MGSQRDLTSNTPQFSYNNEDDSSEYTPANPFADEEGDISSLSSSTHHNINHNINQNQSHLHTPNPNSSQHINLNNSSDYGKPFQAYSGYYSNGGSSNLLVHENLSSDETRLLNNNSRNNYPQNITNGHDPTGDNKLNPSSPAEFDRYPSMAGSRVVSSTSLASQLYNQKQSNSNHKFNSGTSSSMNEETYSNNSPSLLSNDFSPFGGYPASSFPLSIDEKEPDDYIHNPDPIADSEYDKNRFLYDMKNMDKRSLGGLLGFIGLLLGCLAVFVVLPALTYSGVTNGYHPESYEILTEYSYPMISGIRTTLVDPDTPESALTKKSKNGDDWTLVFSDEFNAEGRTFYDGDDQFWTAPDIHYDATKDLEWYDPDASSTANGTLNLRMDAFKNHNLFYRSGMVQSWNKMCFTQGHLEISARLPNYGNVTGLWPGMWSMGNLGRPGYLASTEGVWPYSYDSCDAGITPNQSSPDGISYLPGQRLNACTCPGESHPNRGTGRGAPEIDVIEGEVSTDSTGKKSNIGVASQSLQLAPMDIWYMPDYDFVEIYNASVTTMNTYAGGPFQQALSATTTLNVTWYEMGDNEHNFQTYGYEYLNDRDDGYLRWFVGQDPTLTVYSNALHPDGNIGWRPLSKEPMSLILNLGISNNWAYIDWNSLFFPVTMRIDHVRIYQPKDQINLGCDPDDYPTYDYIQQHLNLYENSNLTSFEDGGYSFPKNNLTKSIGIIGGGPGGLASLYEFLHTDKDGKSTVGHEAAKNPAFSKIVVFEQKDKAGGIWAPATLKADLPVPPQELLNINYNDPNIVRPKIQPPKDVESATYEKPIIESTNELNSELQWKRSGIYPFLFTNIPQRFTRFSYLPDEKEYHDKSRKIYPFLYHQELAQRFSQFIEGEKLENWIRFNTSVEDVSRKDGKWVITARQVEDGKDKWYQETFDAIVVANGHYTVPYIPKIPGLAEYNEKFPNQFIHVKSFRNLNEFKNKDVLIIGGSISTANVLQYLVPNAKSVTNSKRGKHLVFEFINDALVSKGINSKGPIEKFDPIDGVVHFSDGTTGKFDKIIFSTGYHYHFPFLNDNLAIIDPSNNSRVKGLYLDTFSQNDPTLGTVGIAVSHLNFHTIEASAAALAGVWSKGASNELPSKEEQHQWEIEKVAKSGDSNLFHFVPPDNAQEFVDSLKPYFAKGRYQPLEKDGKYIEELQTGHDHLAKLFYDIKDKKLTIEETSIPFVEVK
ncbi:unnamed protein product [Candida verbasci]|uniref:GH16 domain-containing protein n=1 Tax=Candida verbasci TaxID=1227364 RepID=A0A9W4TWZ7_9ASCO|nr:unnamed protein product [Candida verbasci]